MLLGDDLCGDNIQVLFGYSGVLKGSLHGWNMVSMKKSNASLLKK